MATLQRGSFSTYYEESGQGEPVVLICGFGAEVQTWRFTTPELGQRFHLLCFDNRGAGRSSVPDEPYSLRQTRRKSWRQRSRMRNCEFCPADTPASWSILSNTTRHSSRLCGDA